ncbi:predicted protein [Pyrenophora tritici-repentis Pt-1C-BFP]|uniref:Uncharacterized protein n=1 Tax=Pyrenophora tritici-repentis (strain Pt-1C-BFP) TaxID=426418 RepID=B2VSL8_PYRTR|nr:uncharacterized protein PTRG_01774 [Pyrenophora tritici-repentis Pt-1C-BFP]EDU41212.1 predicted protein [Pyrenophora tritici-repentis Pt-1C-BFP]
MAQERNGLSTSVAQLRLRPLWPLGGITKAVAFRCGVVQRSFGQRPNRTPHSMDYPRPGAYRELCSTICTHDNAKSTPEPCIDVAVAVLVKYGMQ